MAASESQIAANRLNALKSCGPKTVEGKQKTRLNGMVHGLASTVLSTEDAQAFEERMDEVAKSMRPRNALEKLILANSVRASWMIDRTARVQTARLDSLIDGEPARAIEEIFSLGKRLFFNAQGPIYGVGRYQYIGNRTSWSGVADHPDDPDTLVRKISSTVLGCLWLLDRFAELRALLLEPGKIWNSQHKFMAIRLLGKQPLDCYTDIQIAEICLRMWTTNPARDNAWIDMRSELGRDEYARFRDTILRQWPQLLDSLDDETERQILRAIVDQAVEQVKVKAAMAAERAERDAARRADCLAFDDSPEGERLRRYELGYHRAFLRSVEAFSKARRDSESDGGDPPESEVGNGEEHTPSPQSSRPPGASPESFPPDAKGGFGGVVSAPPISNASQGGGVVVAPPASSATS